MAFSILEEVGLNQKVPAPGLFLVGDNGFESFIHLLLCRTNSFTRFIKASA